MKKLLGIVILCLLLSSSTYANGISGKQLECERGFVYFIASPVYFVFLEKYKVKRMYVSKKTLKVVENVYDYKPLPETIEIYASSPSGFKWVIRINRETLEKSDTKKSTDSHTQCRIITFSAKEELDTISNQLLNEQSKKNKI